MKLNDVNAVILLVIKLAFMRSPMVEQRALLSPNNKTISGSHPRTGNSINIKKKTFQLYRQQSFIERRFCQQMMYPFNIPERIHRRLICQCELMNSKSLHYQLC